MFQLTKEEKSELVTNWHRFESLKHTANLPYAFTEHGVAMLSSVINSERAIKINIHIIKTFVRLRELIISNKELAKKIEELEKKYDKQFQVVFDAIKELISTKNEPLNPIGFKIGEKKK